MCFVSLVMDQYQPKFPGGQEPAQPFTWITTTTTNPVVSPEEVKELRALIAEFRDAVKLAKELDAVTRQPDCEDPSKAALIDRVAALEKRLDAMGAALK